MRYVALRDDDTNALTPVDYLERLYRPFLERSLSVNLAVIPSVRTDITYGDGIEEGFLVAKRGVKEKLIPLAANRALVEYLRGNRGYCLLQHGCTHEFINGGCEFELHDCKEIERRLECGRAQFQEAGLARPETFVAPYDRFTPASLSEVSHRYRVVSTSWFELRKLPRAWWGAYLRNKLLRRPHLKVGTTIVLSHPGCHLSYHRRYDTMLDEIKRSIATRTLTVLVTHWWEFFRNNRADEAFIEVLHRTAEYLSTTPNIKVVSFREIAGGTVPLS